MGWETLDNAAIVLLDFKQWKKQETADVQTAQQIYHGSATVRTNCAFDVRHSHFLCFGRGLDTCQSDIEIHNFLFETTKQHLGVDKETKCGGKTVSKCHLL